MQLQNRLDYNLYRLGWQSGLHGSLPRILHILLTIFLFYRRGFIEGSQWVEEYYPSKKGSKSHPSQ